MKCAVVIPVGPGHEALALDAIDSVHSATVSCRPFESVTVVRVDDSSGTIGRSAARNEGVRRAKLSGADWIFFLDADDLMHPQAFENAAPHIEHYDAIWGGIYELSQDEQHGIIRPNQLLRISNVAQLLVNDPTLTLQIGHFVKIDIALENPFDVRLDAGEDVDYYLRVWSKYKCIKVPLPLFFNRRGMHATGPRSATGQQWSAVTRKMIREKCAALDLHSDFTYGGETFRFYIFNPFDLIQRCHLKRRFFEVKELEYLKTWVKRDAHIVEVGAYVGNHVVYYSRLMRPRSITVLEPNVAILDLLRRNLAANGVINADLSLLGMAAGNSEAAYRVVCDEPDNLGTARLELADQGPVKCAPLDKLVYGHVDFMKIDVEGMELDVLQGAAEIIAQSRPKIMIEVFMNNVPVFTKWAQQNAYRIAREFRYVNAMNFMVEPSEAG